MAPLRDRLNPHQLERRAMRRAKRLDEGHEPPAVVKRPSAKVERRRRARARDRIRKRVAGRLTASGFPELIALTLRTLGVGRTGASAARKRRRRTRQATQRRQR